jgi:UDP-4-amino-4,6-dideoxy-N-acetyl-beta-L-altrosamine N-acetyltransferase
METFLERKYPNFLKRYSEYNRFEIKPLHFIQIHLKYQYQMPLKPISESDLSLILEWRNTPTVREAMFSSHIIEPEEHLSWFQRIHNDTRSKWLLYSNSEDKPLGVVYFTSIDWNRLSAFWGFYTAPDATPGTGLRMSLEALNLAFDELKLYKLNAEALAGNMRSINMHKSVGFIEEGRFRNQHLNRTERSDVIRFGILSEEWAVHKVKLQSRINELDILANKKLSSSTPPHKIVILSDSHSWINFYIEDLITDWSELGHFVHWRHDTKDLPTADFCFCLSFSKIVSKDIRNKFKHTVVVHESELPKGRGWSPLTWQILEGKNIIPVTLLEAEDSVDSGKIYKQTWIDFFGSELVDELRDGQAKATKELCQWFVDEYPQSTNSAKEQKGTPTYYNRRLPKDSQIDLNKSLFEQFNLLRIVDNQKYPAYFIHKGLRYNLAIEKDSK